MPQNAAAEIAVYCGIVEATSTQFKRPSGPRSAESRASTMGIPYREAESRGGEVESVGTLSSQPSRSPAGYCWARRLYWMSGRQTVKKGMYESLAPASGCSENLALALNHNRA
jgi:hypothetical protein